MCYESVSEASHIVEITIPLVRLFELFVTRATLRL